MNTPYQLINCQKDRTKNCNDILSEECPRTCEYYKIMSGYYVQKEIGWNLEGIFDNWKEILK